MYDVFISHASRDKIKVANSLLNELEMLGLNCFYDSSCLVWGDHWKDRILRAINDSERGLFIISPAFFNRTWTERELKAFLTRQNSTNQSIIYPLLYRTTIEKVIKHYPFLAGIQMERLKNNSATEIHRVAESFIQSLGRGSKWNEHTGFSWKCIKG